MHLQALLPRDQTVVGIRQVAVRRETYHVTRTGNGFQPRMPFKSKPPPENIFREPVDSQRNKLSPLVAQQRRGIARQHVTQRGDKPLKTVLMTDTGLQFNGDLRQHIYGKTHGCLAVILTINSVILTVIRIVIMTTHHEL